MTNAEITELEQRIGPAARDPKRRHRRHPYLLQPGDGQAVRDLIRADTGKVIESMEGAIKLAVRRAYRFADPQTHEDMEQNTRMHLASRVVPSYDQSAGAKFSTFAFLCIGRFVVGQARRQRKLTSTPTDPALLDTERTTTTTTSCDHNIERIAAAVLAQPEVYLGDRAGEATRRIAAGEAMKDVAEDMGIAPATLSMCMKRARARLLQHDVQTAELLG
jgi:hypothetical protein